MLRTHIPACVTSALLSAGLFFESASAQISISPLPGGSYSQNFDSLASSGTNTWADNSTFAGWYAAKTNNGTSSSFTNYIAGTGSGTAGALYSFGASGSSERALGSLASGNVSIGDIAYGVRFANDTGSDITSITITYTGEQWRNSGNINPQKLTFWYRVSPTPLTDPDPANAASWTPFTALDFTTPTVGGSTGALDGNAPANRQTFSGVFVTGVAVPAGSEIFLRWRDINDSGNDHGLAIDDLTVNFSGGTITTNAPTYALVTPLAQTNKAGTTTSLTATSDGYPSISLSYQWRKDGIPLSDSGNISGSATPTLTMTNVLAANAGSYDVIVANASGSVTSDAATVTVVDPAIQSQSANQARLGGESVTFTATAKGTPTLTYQWCFGSMPISGATGSALALSNLQAADQGPYTCWVTNALGASVASAPIVLTVTVLPSVTLALWDFNDTNAPLASPPPAVGPGTASLLNGVTPSFVTGASADPGGTNRAWNTTGYPAQGTSNQTAGVQFNVSTLGYQNILLRWNERHSSTGSKYTRLQYTTDGMTFTDLNFNAMTAPDTFVLLSSDLSALSAVNNNANFAFRVVSEFESSSNPNYIGTSGSYSTGGTIRFDLVIVYGDAYSPGTLAPTTISNIIGTTLTYGGGSGPQFALLQSASLATPRSAWTRVHTNFATPGAFTVPAGSGNAAFYSIKSE
jgi:hypothetical protein